MTEPTGCTTCCHAHDVYCDRCDLLVGLPGLHVVGVKRATREGCRSRSSRSPLWMGCPSCGVVAGSHGRRTVRLVDTPAFGAPTVLLWRKRTRRPRTVVPGASVHRAGRLGRQAAGDAHHEGVPLGRGATAPRARLDRRVGLPVGHDVADRRWSSIAPILKGAAGDEARFAGVTTSAWTSISGTTSTPASAGRRS